MRALAHGATGLKLRGNSDPEGLRCMTVGGIRDSFVIGDLFRPGEVAMTYVEVDRAVVGSAVPLDLPLCLATDRRLAARYFCERREVGVINIGGPGWVRLDGGRHELPRRDSPYIRPGLSTRA